MTKSAFEENKEVKTKMPGDDGFNYDLMNRDHKKIVEDFEQELNAFTGPCKFDLYCMSKGYFSNVEVRNYTFQGVEYQKPESYSLRNDMMRLYVKDKQKMNALSRSSLMKERSAKETAKHIDELNYIVIPPVVEVLVNPEEFPF